MQVARTDLAQKIINFEGLFRIAAGDGGESGSGDDGSDGVDDGISTTAEYSTISRSFVLPVEIGDILYRVIMFQDSLVNGAVFSVDTGRIFSLLDTGQERAIMNLDEGILTIPSIRVNNKVFTDVVFSLTDFSTLTFKLESYNQP